MAERKSRKQNADMQVSPSVRTKILFNVRSVLRYAFGLLRLK